MAVTVDTADVIRWDAQYNLGRSATATLVLDNRSRRYAVSQEDLRGQIVTLTGIMDSTEYVLFRGRVKAQRAAYHGIKKTVEVTAVSVCESLNRRPINTHTYGLTGIDIKVLLRDLIGVYGGVNSDWYEINTGSLVVSNILLEENSLLDGLRKLAQASSLELYERYDGKLVTDGQKTSASVLDFYMEPQDIRGDVSEDLTEIDRFSACKIRGRYLLDSEIGAARTVLASAVRTCNVEDTDYATFTTTLDNTGYGLNELLNAEIITTRDGVTGRVIRYDPPNVTIALMNANNDWTSENVDVEFTVSAERAGSKEVLSVDAQGLGHGMKSVPDRFGVLQMLRNTLLATGIQDRQQTRLSNELSENRIDLLVADPAIVSEIGLRFQEVDNLYIPSNARAQVVAERLIYENTLGGHVLYCSGPLRPELRELNSVVSVPLFTGATTHERVLCLLAGIRFSYVPRGPSIRSDYTFLKL